MVSWHARKYQHIDAQVCCYVHITTMSPRPLSLACNIIWSLATHTAHHGNPPYLSKYRQNFAQRHRPTYPLISIFITLAHHPLTATSLPLPPPLSRTPQPNLPLCLYLLSHQSRHRYPGFPSHLQANLCRVHRLDLHFHRLLRRRLGDSAPMAETSPTT